MSGTALLVTMDMISSWTLERQVLQNSSCPTGCPGVRDLVLLISSTQFATNGEVTLCSQKLAVVVTTVLSMRPEAQTALARQ